MGSAREHTNLMARSQLLASLLFFLHVLFAMIEVFKRVRVFLLLVLVGLGLAYWATRGESRRFLPSGMPGFLGSARSGGGEASPAGPRVDSPLARVGDSASRFEASAFERGSDAERRYRLERVLAAASGEELDALFVDFMSRDLEGGFWRELAGETLREIARRDGYAGMAALYALGPAERAILAESLARGWVAHDSQAAFDWIAQAWIDAEGTFVDRDLQNRLFRVGIDALLERGERFGEAAAVLRGVRDPQERAFLAERVAEKIVQDGPERALERLALIEAGDLDVSVMDAISREWAARDSAGAADWTIANQGEISERGARGIARQLAVEERTELLRSFHASLREGSKRDAVAAEAARLSARRDPLASGEWVHAIEGSDRKRFAVSDALREIGYDDFEHSLDYIEFAFGSDQEGKGPVLLAALEDWTRVDASKVEVFLSGRSDFFAIMARKKLFGEGIPGAP